MYCGGGGVFCGVFGGVLGGGGGTYMVTSGIACAGVVQSADEAAIWPRPLVFKLEKSRHVRISLQTQQRDHEAESCSFLFTEF